MDTFLKSTLQDADKALKKLLDSHPELRSVAIVFDWGVPGARQLPPGVYTPRDKRMAVGEINHMAESIARMGQSLFEIIATSSIKEKENGQEQS